jgi:hypothetical protein
VFFRRKGGAQIHRYFKRFWGALSNGQGVASDYLVLEMRLREVSVPDLRGINISNTQILRARRTDLALVWIVAIAVPFLLIAPALWNGYPLLQYDTGGYLARWYEGYLVPSRSTAYGIYLHLGEASHFWLNLGVQALSVMWIVQAMLRVFGIARPLQIAAIVTGLCATTALPVLTSLLLTDIFAGLSVLTLFLLVVHGGRFSRPETLFLYVATLRPHLEIPMSPPRRTISRTKRSRSERRVRWLCPKWRRCRLLAAGS